MGRERTKGRKLLKKIDEFYFRARDAWRVLTDATYLDEIRNEGRTVGEWTTKGRIERTLDDHDPHQFTNQHFKLGYYYAKENVRRAFNGNDNPME